MTTMFSNQKLDPDNSCIVFLPGWNQVFFKLNFIFQDLVIKEAERVLDPSKQPGNLRFAIWLAFPTNRLGECLHDKV